ncbi:hypothetical protein BKA70DRAFT_1229434 [Coprinopsis sp. MPI-PUGE-AT-0042]|nr:hypothetical protein BKA70DRAFT_1229434 [Coprinopsis sp. MPI-PUGE-AT-0042]
MTDGQKKTASVFGHYVASPPAANDFRCLRWHASLPPKKKRRIWNVIPMSSECFPRPYSAIQHLVIQGATGQWLSSRWHVVTPTDEGRSILWSMDEKEGAGDACFADTTVTVTSK